MVCLSGRLAFRLILILDGHWLWFFCSFVFVFFISLTFLKTWIFEAVKLCYGGVQTLPL